MAYYIMKRDLDGATVYFCKFDTPRKARIKGHKEWTFDVAYAQQFSQAAWMPADIMKNALAAGMKVSVETVN